MDQCFRKERSWKLPLFGLCRGVSIPSSKRPLRKAAGFSLVETAIAIGLMAFALVSIMGLVPMGLTTFRKAMDTSVGSQIVQQVLADVQQASDISQQAGAQTFRYFDDQGNYLGNSETTGTIPSTALYHVNTVVQFPSQYPQGHFSDKLATILIEIATNPQNTQLQLDVDTSKIAEEPNVQVARYSVLVAAQD